MAATRITTRITFPFVVGFFHKSKETGCPISTDYMVVAKFRCKSEAFEYAIMAYTKFPSPNDNLRRIYEVRQNDKLVYRAG